MALGLEEQLKLQLKVGPYRGHEELRFFGESFRVVSCVVVAVARPKFQI